MKYLDYNRTCGKDVDIPLRTFLLTIHDNDIIRRARVAFPEYFTDKRPVIKEVQLNDIILRFNAIEADPNFEDDYGEPLAVTLDWFGIKLYSHEYRADGKKSGDCELLPQDFKRERANNYNGLKADNHWLVTLATEDCPEGQEHLVIETLVTGYTSPEYFLWTIPTRNIGF